jgi:hypothetical protein
MQFIRFTFLSALLLAAAAFGQSKLPACKGSDTTKWSNCIGTATFKNSVYVGEWKGGKSHGQGTETRSEGDKYVGEFKNDQYNGQGTITFADGNKYVGKFKDGTYNGQGTYTHANGDKYVGEFRDGKYNGQGTATFANGDKYVGEYKNNNRNGQGTATYSDGNKYVGEFKDDKANGQGIYTTADGKRQEGIWEDNSFIREANVNLPRLDTNTAKNNDLLNGNSSGVNATSAELKCDSPRSISDPKIVEACLNKSVEALQPKKPKEKNQVIADSSSCSKIKSLTEEDLEEASGVMRASFKSITIRRAKLAKVPLFFHLNPMGSHLGLQALRENFYIIGSICEVKLDTANGPITCYVDVHSDGAKFWGRGPNPYRNCFP